MRNTLFTALAFISAGAASAGTLVYTPPAVTMIEEPARMGGSGAWLIPLVIVAVLALALTADNNEPVNGRN